VPIASAGERVYAAVMRYFLAALFAMFLLSGCMSDPEERTFFYGGWMKPEKSAEQRLNTR